MENNIETEFKKDEMESSKDLVINKALKELENDLSVDFYSLFNDFTDWIVWVVSDTEFCFGR